MKTNAAQCASVLLLMSWGCSNYAPAQETGCEFLSVEAAVLGGDSSSTLALTEKQNAALIPLVDPLGNTVCTGTLIAPSVILTAKHCLLVTLSANLGSDLVVSPDRIARHPELDLAALEFDLAFAEDRVLPISPSVLPLEPEGEVAVIAGFGLTEEGSVGSLNFAFVRLEQTDADRYVTSADGTGGACPGDSGGPLLWRARDGEVKLFGVLSGGSSSCRGQDYYTRIDTDYWTQRYLNPEPLVECNALPAEGYCFTAKSATWCKDDYPVVQTCRSNEQCGWSDPVGAIRCVEEQFSPCGDVPVSGRCEGSIAVWCDSGELNRRDCSACGGRCARSADDGRVSCVE